MAATTPTHSKRWLSRKRAMWGWISNVPPTAREVNRVCVATTPARISERSSIDWRQRDSSRVADIPKPNSRMRAKLILYAWIKARVPQTSTPKTRARYGTVMRGNRYRATCPPERASKFSVNLCLRGLTTLPDIFTDPRMNQRASMGNTL